MSSRMEIAAAVAARHRDLNNVLEATDPGDLLEASELPGWSRLTIVCHLRYGAQASERMTRDALAGLPTGIHLDQKAGCGFSLWGIRRSLCSHIRAGEIPGYLVAKLPGQ